MRVNASWPGVSRKTISRPERRRAFLGELHLVGADVLRNSARLARRHVGLADRVEQRSLAVIDVAHHGDHRRTRHLEHRPVVLGSSTSSMAWFSSSSS
jgi:hypothetical protein